MEATSVRWWGEFPVPVDDDRFWEIGPLRLWVRRSPHEWSVTHEAGDDALSRSLVVAGPGSTASPGEKAVQRDASRPSGLPIHGQRRGGRKSPRRRGRRWEPDGTVTGSVGNRRERGGASQGVGRFSSAAGVMRWIPVPWHGLSSRRLLADRGSAHFRALGRQWSLPAWGGG